MLEKKTRARKRPVILLVAEAVTLAHFARIATLSKALDASAYEVVMASDPRFAALEAPLGNAFHPIWSIPSADFARSLAHGRPLYDADTLSRYVEEDLALIRTVSPDLIVGDFRLSLGVSAQLARVPYAAVVNAYWSPYAKVEYPVPDLALTRMLGVTVAQRIFDAARPLAFALHARPLEQVRRRYRLPAIGHDLRTAYTMGDFTLYADVPDLVAMRPLPAHHRHIGPPLWSANVPLPGWWDRLPDDRPVVTLTLGTSGRAELLPLAVAALAELPVSLIVATAERGAPMPASPNVFFAEFLPLAQAARRSRVMVCNGGSLTTYQALAAGIPVVGIGSNLDQLLNMRAIEATGAGIGLRAGNFRPGRLKDAVRAALRSSHYDLAAKKAAERLSHIDAGKQFRTFVRDVVPGA
jgi:UDP:flavonoid glycosyltransferase YjiC (YdhE family)